MKFKAREVQYFFIQLQNRSKQETYGQTRGLINS